MKICVIGLGYIGLPTASVLATSGHKVVGVDLNEKIVEQINKGQVHIEERGLKTLFSAAIQSKNLRARTKAVQSDVFIIAVPTPEKNHKADLSNLKSAVRSIVPFVQKGNIVVVESTIPPGTTESVVVPALSRSGLKPGEGVHIAHCPERVLPGSILRELVVNDRVIGGLTPACAEKTAEVYRSFVQGRIELCDLRTAEMVKLVENSFRDTNIAFANTISNMCMDFGIESARVMELANMHPRVNILSPGPGVGGHCIPIDPWFLIESAPRKSALLSTARRINDSRPQVIVSVLSKMIGRGKKAKVAVLGVSYKGDVDDVRLSPAKPVIEELEKRGVEVCVYDPYVKMFYKDLMNIESALSGADAAVIMAGHSDFKYLNPEGVGTLMRSKKLLDPFSMVNKELWEASGFTVVRL